MAGSSERLGGVTASAGAVRWRKLLEAGVYETIEEIAAAEKINSSYVSRLLRLTLLAPATVEAILGGRADAGPTLAEAMKVFPVEWSKQSSNTYSRMWRRLADRLGAASVPSYKRSMRILFPLAPELIDNYLVTILDGSSFR